MRIVLAIPARYESSRLPGKPLIPLNGIPMIARTYKQCAKAVDPAQIYVLTDDARIQAVCESIGAKVIMTSKNCRTGTDRIGELLSKVDADLFINVQGDEPLFDPNDLLKLIAVAEENPHEIINGFCPIYDEAQFNNPNIPKVVTRPDGRLLYMSRAGIPTGKDFGYSKAFRQVCAYAFPRKALEEFSKSEKKTELESIEDIEILRFLELGWEIRMIEMSGLSIAVDTPEDVERVELELSRLQQK